MTLLPTMVLPLILPIPRRAKVPPLNTLHIVVNQP